MKNKKDYCEKTDLQRLLKAFREIYYNNLGAEDRKRVTDFCKIRHPLVFKLLSIEKLYN